MDKDKGKQYKKEPKIEDTATDLYYNTKERLEDSKVAIPTQDAVEKAKEWVDEINRK